MPGAATAKLQSQLASYVGHFKRASCRRLVQGIRTANPWLETYFVFDQVALQWAARVVALPQARTVYAQYRHWRLAYPNDVVLIQVGGFYERLRCLIPGQGPGHHLATGSLCAGLRRMRPTGRGAIEGFPVGQLMRRLSKLLENGCGVAVVGELPDLENGLRQRQPIARWVRA